MDQCYSSLKFHAARSFGIWEAVQFAATVTRKFDFEGSMIETVERFFRGFGAKQVPYFAVSNMSLRMAPLYYGRQLMRSLLGK